MTMGVATPGSGGTKCRKCDDPVRVEGEPFLGRAVHAATGEELGGDGHLAAPIDAGMPYAGMPYIASAGGAQ
jgi:hypothetical protein